MSKLQQTQYHKIFPVELKKGTLIVTPAGDSVSFRDSDVHKEIEILLELVDDPQVKNLVVDLGASPYFGTTIIGAFNALGMKFREAGGKIALCNLSDDMRGILGVMHLDELWPRFSTRKEALRGVGG